MKLSIWMDMTGRTPESLSEELEARGRRASSDLIRKVLSGVKRFGIDTIYEIQRLSGGKVTFGDLYIPLTEIQKASNT